MQGVKEDAKPNEIAYGLTVGTVLLPVCQGVNDKNIISSSAFRVFIETSFQD